DWRPVRRNHKHLTADDINGAFRDAGTWVGAAQLLGISYKGLQALRRYRKMLPPREPTPPRTDLTLERFAALKEEYGSLRKAAAALGLNYSSMMCVYYRRQKAARRAV